MCGSFGGAVHVNSGVREGSPSRRSYEGCATIVSKNTKVFFKVRNILDIQPIFTLRITAIRHGELKIQDSRFKSIYCHHIQDMTRLQ